MSKTNVTENVNDCIDSSIKNYNWLVEYLEGIEISSIERHALAGACFDMTMEHYKASLNLISGGIYGSAFALTRLLLEAHVRGVWLHRCATEKQITHYKRGETPSFDTLVSQVDELEGYEHKTFSNIKEKYWKTMNSFTHTGIAQTSRRQSDDRIGSNYSDREVIKVLTFTNSIALLNGLSICILAGDGERSGPIKNRAIELSLKNST